MQEVGNEFIRSGSWAMHGGIKFSLSPTKFKHSAVSCVEQYCSISYQKHINCRFMATATWLEFDTLFRWWLLNYGEFSLATCTVTESLLCQTPVCSPRWTEWISETTTESQGVHAQRSTRKWIHAHFSTTNVCVYVYVCTCMCVRVVYVCMYVYVCMCC